MNTDEKEEKQTKQKINEKESEIEQKKAWRELEGISIVVKSTRYERSLFAQLLAHAEWTGIEVSDSVGSFFYCKLNSLAHSLLSSLTLVMDVNRKVQIHSRRAWSTRCQFTTTNGTRTNTRKTFCICLGVSMCCCCCRLGISCENKIYDQLNYFWVGCDKERAAWSLSVCCWLCSFYSRQLPVLAPSRWKTYNVASRIDAFDLLDTCHQNGVVKLLLLLWSCEWCCEYVCLVFIANNFIGFSFWPQIFTLDDIFLIRRLASPANVDVWEERECGNGRKVAETAHLHCTVFKNWKKRKKKNGVVLDHSPLSTQCVAFKLVFLFFNYCYCWPLLLKLF